MGGIGFPNWAVGNCGICIGDIGAIGDMGKENGNMPGIGIGGIAPGFCIICT
jgi:hypothetical protein